MDQNTDYLRLFSTTSEKKISHSYLNTAANAAPQALTSIAFNSVMDLPSTHLTTARGRGGLGASKQMLCDVFWQMTTSVASAKAVQTLLHYYIQPATLKDDADMKVTYGFPMNSYSANTAAGKSTGNDGRWALATGLKIYIAPNDQPLADYYGFYALRMAPFFKATGGNEIDVVVNSARAVKCWSWGSEQGEGWAHVYAYVGNTYFPGDSKYNPIYQFA